jgi:catechol 2,3-dioxygenase-like lactoylglutathione lyase family enzyme
MRVLGIDNVLLAAGDLAEALEFYGGKLGLPVKFQVPEAGIAAFQIGDEEPGLLVRVQAPAGPRVWVEVPDARQAAEELGGIDLAPLAPPFEVHTGWAFEVADPWGNVIGFTDYQKDPARARPTARSS